MLIAVDGYEASADNRVGVGRFEVELLKGLYSVDEKNSYRIYTPRAPKPDLPRTSKHWKYRIASFNRLWSQAALPFYTMIDRPKPDVFFSPVHYAPRFITIPLVLGIMDLSFLFFPDMFRSRDLFKLKQWTMYSVKKAKRIIAISQSTKNDILKKYYISPDKVTVIYPGITNYEITKLNTTYSKIAQKFGIVGDYILYVGTLQPRKNIVRLIEAFELVSKRQTANGKRLLQLVIVGKKGWLYDTIFAKVKDLGIEDRVIFTGFVPDEELPVLYAHATCFCLVSLYEGFGFPVLEAMKEGTPVVASNVSSLPELVADAGILVNPEDVTDIAHGIIDVLKMKDEDRMKLITRGKKQAAKFTWEKTARETLKVLEEVGNEG
ncbi:MAG: Glycosyl transferase group 1 [Candidatus Roizmanbacteria bacterium GW2011_GWA1_41_13]|uniref:Glycosyl transferase group 1 n=1 Tax=Candidatus Roizmanbacteria bacterium GW2011_GWA1_41_13 TaxID=1618474 RepID=A0A0G0Y1X4_9BACT|nr:MAG: Glycosyl transferase group 1 [Candidatus Roizmanbacteria bacterium GW2011_GWA1_41_13]